MTRTTAEKLTVTEKLSNRIYAKADLDIVTKHPVMLDEIAGAQLVLRKSDSEKEELVTLKGVTVRTYIPNPEEKVTTVTGGLIPKRRFDVEIEVERHAGQVKEKINIDRFNGVPSLRLAGILDV